MKEIELSGLDGTNPLGYLAALGVLRVMDGAVRIQSPTLRWDPESWRPVLGVDGASSPDELVEILWSGLRRTPGKGVRETVEAKKAFEEAQVRARKKRDEIKKRKLSRNEARAARDTELRPLQEEASRLRKIWRARLTESAPDPVMSLGANLTVSEQEFQEFCADAVAASTASDRAWTDFCAAFGCEYGTGDESRRMHATPLALVSGSGHQDFLGSVAKLMVSCTMNHVREAVLGPWKYEDRKYSLRWDPVEDRRYALMARNPTASGNEPTTVWGANRLAFEALPLFSCVPTSGGTRTVCVAHEKEVGRTYFQWPLWAPSLTLDSVRSLLGLRELSYADTASVRRCRARGVIAVYRSQRIKVGTQRDFKLNLTPAVPVWS
jgi:hypothetical protein